VTYGAGVLGIEVADDSSFLEAFGVLPQTEEVICTIRSGGESVQTC
jgi:hypothetical protein